MHWQKLPEMSGIDTRFVLTETMLTNRIITAPKRVLGTPLASFPIELLESILGFAITNLLQSTTKHTLSYILRRYRALVMTCRVFKFVLDNASVQLVVQTWFSNPWRSTNPQVLVLDPSVKPSHGRTHDRTGVLTNWADIFKTIQKLSVRNMEFDLFNKKTLGKFWMNPIITVDDISLDHYGPVNVNLVVNLGPMFHRTKRRPTDEERKTYPRLPSPYYDSELVNVITTCSKKLYIYSVHTWGTRYARRNSAIGLSSSNVAREVSEWWVWQTRSYYRTETYIMGYHKGNVWLVDLDSAAIYTSLREKPPWR